VWPVSSINYTAIAKGGGEAVASERKGKIAAQKAEDIDKN